MVKALMLRAHEFEFANSTWLTLSLKLVAGAFFLKFDAYFLPTYYLRNASLQVLLTLRSIHNQNSMVQGKLIYAYEH
jgi:hypothetical protein